MAKITLKEKRPIDAGYHIYRQPTEAGDLITVRRKVAMPTDVQHKSSKETTRHRQIFAKASERWAALPSLVKRDLSNNYGIVPVQGHFAQPDVKVLKGRQLFLSQEIHAQQYHQKHTETPLWLCVQTISPTGKLIPVDIALYYAYFTPHYSIPRYHLSLSDTLFYPVPIVDRAYRFVAADWTHLQYPYQNYYYPGILQVRHVGVCPRLREKKTSGPWQLRTNSYNPNWHYFPTAGDHLWIVEAHQNDGTGPESYFDYPMARFTVTLLDYPLVNLHFEPLAFAWDEKFMRDAFTEDYPYWQVHITAPGQWEINPPQLNLVINLDTAEAVGYQD